MAHRRIETVLVVDDEAPVRTLFERAFTRRERRVMTAAGPREATALATLHKPDLAIVDLRLGTASGIDVIRDLKRRCSSATIVMISGYLSIDATVAAVRAGADFVLLKPVSCDEILARVDHGAQVPLPTDATPTLARVEWEHISRVMTDCNGNISMAARRLGVYRSTLQRRLRKEPPRW